MTDPQDRDPEGRITSEVREHVLLIGIDRPEKFNGFTPQMFHQLGAAYQRLEDDPQLRVGVLFAHGKHFTAGLDLAEVGPAVRGGAPLFPDGAVDPLGLRPPLRTKPLIMAVQGWCLTIGIELLLATDIRLAATGTRFGQIEINRGLYMDEQAVERLDRFDDLAGAIETVISGLLDTALILPKV